MMGLGVYENEVVRRDGEVLLWRGISDFGGAADFSGRPWTARALLDFIQDEYRGYGQWWGSEDEARFYGAADRAPRPSGGYGDASGVLVAAWWPEDQISEPSYGHDGLVVPEGATARIERVEIYTNDGWQVLASSGMSVTATEKTASLRMLWRGLCFGEHDASEFEHDPGDFLRRMMASEKSLGIHWTDDASSAYNFALDRDPEGWAHESDEEPEGVLVGAVIEVEVDEQHIIDPDSEEGRGYAMSDAILDYGVEREVTVRDGAPVRVTKAVLAWMDPDVGEREVDVPMSMSMTAANEDVVAQALRLLPAADRSLLDSRGVKVEETTQRYAPAWYDPDVRTIFWNDNISVPTLVHEYGHAIDHALGWISESAAFKSIAQQYNPPSTQGAERVSRWKEAWADGYCALFGGQTPMWWPGNDTDLAMVIRDARTQRDINITGSETYQTGHQPDEGGPPANDLLADGEWSMPDDVYEHLDRYTGEQGMLDETERALRKSRGNPSAIVTIYRASPPAATKINNGDWVTLSKAYAEQHRDSKGDADWVVHSADVPASTVRFAGDDLMEWGYWGPSTIAKTASEELPRCTNCNHFLHSHGRFERGGRWNTRCRAQGCSCPAPIDPTKTAGYNSLTHWLIDGVEVPKDPDEMMPSGPGFVQAAMFISYDEVEKDEAQALGIGTGHYCMDHGFMVDTAARKHGLHPKRYMHDGGAGMTCEVCKEDRQKVISTLAGSPAYAGAHGLRPEDRSPARSRGGRDRSRVDRGAPGRARSGLGRVRAAGGLRNAVFVVKGAREDYMGLTAQERARVRDAIEDLKSDARPVQAKRLAGVAPLRGLYRLAVGDSLRVLYGTETVADRDTGAPRTLVTVYGCGQHENFYDRVKRRLGLAIPGSLG